jgi:hypothetical protein
VQQSTLRLDFAQHAGGLALQQFTVDDLQHPSGAAEVSCVPLQQGKQVVVPVVGVQLAPLVGVQHPAKGPNPHPHDIAPVMPQQPDGLGGFAPTVEQWVPKPPPCTGEHGCVPALQNALAPQVLQLPPPWQQQQQPEIFPQASLVPQLWTV